MAKKTNLKSWAVISVLLAGILCATASGGVIYVDANAPPGGNGQTWATAYKYLQDGLAVAVASDEIWVADGTYNPDANSADPNGSGKREATFQLINGVAIYGGFAGGESSLDERDWETNETILSGDINTPDVNTDNSYHVVAAGYAEPNAVLDGFTITGGNANGSPPDNYNWGGGMYNWNSNPTVTNCTFSGNSAEDGGGMYNYGSNPNVTNCTFSGNPAGHWGGGMCNRLGSNPMVTNCTFSDNSADDGGGMYIDNFSSSTVTNCTFSGNSASGGGGMYNVSSSTVTNCTFSGNSAGDDGGGMYNSSSSPTVGNCILWGNTDSGPTDESAQIISGTVNYCCVQGWTGGLGGTGNIGDDPNFVDPNGPDNIIGTEDDNLRLMFGSPCIDAGDNAAVPYPGFVSDLDGRPRFMGGTCNGAIIVDMGAYELAGVYLGDLDEDCDVDFYDFGYFANNWLVGK